MGYEYSSMGVTNATYESIKISPNCVIFELVVGCCQALKFLPMLGNDIVQCIVFASVLRAVVEPNLGLLTENFDRL